MAASPGQPIPIAVLARIGTGKTRREARAKLAGPSQLSEPLEAPTVDPGAFVVLDGSTSGFPEAQGRPLSYRWSQVFGPLVEILDDFSAVSGFGAPRLPGTGTRDLVFHLVVDDGVVSNSQAVARVSVRAFAAPTTVAVPLLAGMNLISLPARVQWTSLADGCFFADSRSSTAKTSSCSSSRDARRPWLRSRAGGLAEKSRQWPRPGGDPGAILLPRVA